jgi:hypothetical protein
MRAGVNGRQAGHSVASLLPAYCKFSLPLLDSMYWVFNQSTVPTKPRIISALSSGGGRRGEGGGEGGEGLSSGSGSFNGLSFASAPPPRFTTGTTLPPLPALDRSTAGERRGDRIGEGGGDGLYAGSGSFNAAFVAFTTPPRFATRPPLPLDLATTTGSACVLFLLSIRPGAASLLWARREI